MTDRVQELLARATPGPLSVNSQGSLMGPDFHLADTRADAELHALLRNSTGPLVELLEVAELHRREPCEHSGAGHTGSCLADDYLKSEDMCLRCRTVDAVDSLTKALT